MSFIGGRRRSHKRRARTRARRSRLGKTMKSVDQLVGLPFGAVGLKKPATRVLSRLGVTMGGKRRRRKSHKKHHTKRHRRHSRKHSRKHT
jgi:hypothetical protein